MASPLLIGLCLAMPPGPPVAVERRVAVMGTTVDVAVVAASRKDGLAASETVLAELSRVESLLTTWRPDSPLARLNVASPGEDRALDPELFAVLTEVFGWATKTNRAFDPTVGPLVRAWDLRGVGRIPSDSEVVAALAATGPSRFRFDAGRRTVARLDPAAGIEEGAWGKGYALDRAGRRLAEAGVAGALVDLGGQVLARGGPSPGMDWEISIAHPRDRERPVVSLSIRDVSVSTSGDSERRRVAAGRAIGHLLDPRSGRPAPDFGSATVVAPSALVADVLSTAFFVLGPESGLALSETLRREGVPNEILFLVERGGALDAVFSPGIPRLVVSNDPSVSMGAGRDPALRAHH